MPRTAPAEPRHAVTKAVIPAAGWGTRFLPFTKVVPKELLPIVDKPALLLIAEEAIAAGLNELIFVISPDKEVIRRFFEPDAELERRLITSGRADVLSELNEVITTCRISFVYQKSMRGLGDAVIMARESIGDDVFALMLGDSLTRSTPNGPHGLTQLLETSTQHQCSVIATRNVPPDQVSNYGIIDGVPVEPQSPALWRVHTMIEKPDPDEAPSERAVAGRYVFTPGILNALDEVTPDDSGEIQLTDAIRLLCDSEPVLSLNWDAIRYDLGSRLEYAKCFVDFALERPDIGAELREHLGTLVENED